MAHIYKVHLDNEDYVHVTSRRDHGPQVELVQRRWVHLSYAHDLMMLGFKPDFGFKVFSAFSLPRSEWEAFASMYDPEPILFEEPPYAEG